MQKTLHALESRIPLTNLCNLVLSYCGWKSVPVNHNAAYLYGVFELWEACEGLEHPFINDAFLGAATSGNLELVKCLVAKGAYGIGMYDTHPSLDPHISEFLDEKYFECKDYGFFTKAHDFTYSVSLCAHMDSKTNWNMALTSACLESFGSLGMLHFGVRTHMALALQQGANECYACTDSVKTHKKRCGYRNLWERFWVACRESLPPVAFVGIATFCASRIALNHCFPCQIDSQNFTDSVKSSLGSLVGGWLVMLYTKREQIYRYECLSDNTKVNVALF